MPAASDVPFVRFSRDNRGYEYVYLVHVPSGRPGRSRVLYWYRSPPGVKVGRPPFQLEVQRALEAANPDLRFDWKSITEAQPPPAPEVEHWRERRRAERSAKQARQATAREDAAPSAESVDVDEAAEGQTAAGEPAAPIGDDSPPVSETNASATPAVRVDGDRRPRRRRRRGGRGRGGTAMPTPTSTASAEPVQAVEGGDPEQAFGSGESGPADETS